MFILLRKYVVNLSDSNKKIVYYNVVFILLKNNKLLKKLRSLFH
jgi:hypothetical protein